VIQHRRKIPHHKAIPGQARATRADMRSMRLACRHGKSKEIQLVVVFVPPGHYMSPDYIRCTKTAEERP
jgi:hypothetical protein